jgi:hypothetical protein
VSCDKNGYKQVKSRAAIRRFERDEHRDQLHDAAAVAVRAPDCRLACLLAALAARAAQQSADTILLDGKIVNSSPLRRRRWRCAAIASWRSGARRTSARSPARDARDRSRRPHRHSRLIDSHIHAIRAGLTYTTEVHWIGARSLGEALDRCAPPRKRRRREAGWCVGRRLDRNGQFAERRRPTQAEIAGRPRPDHHVYVQLLYSAVLLTRGRDRRRSGILNDSALASRLTIETGPDGQPTGWIAADNRDHQRSASIGCRAPHGAAGRRHARRSFRTLKQPRHHRRARSRRLQHADRRPIRPCCRSGAIARCTLRVVYSLCAPRRDDELADFKELTAMLPMGFGDDWLRFNGIGENVTWGMYNNERTVGGAEGAALSGAPLGGAARPDGDVPLAQQSLGASSARCAGAREPRDAGRALRWSVAHLNDASPRASRA